MATVSHSKTEWTVALSLPSALFFILLFLIFHSFVTVNTQDMLNRLLGNQIFLHLFLHLTIFCILEESMIYGHMGDKKKAKECFEMYYRSVVLKLSEGAHIKRHLEYLDKLRNQLEW